ncbi:origin recognition complex subunit 5 [Syncephalis fuscata]|nr:origin recognition complex subunit 5 [Syncephalis fuscata]
MAVLPKDTTSNIEDFNKQFPGREQEIDQLYSLLGKPDNPLPPVIFINGKSATGKTCVVRAFVEQLPRKHWAYINAVDRFSPRLLFEDALNQFSNTRPTFRDGVCHGYARCDTEADFIQHLRSLFTETLFNTSLDEHRRVLVIDRAERLRDMAPSLLASLLRLAELTEANISVILISSVIWDKFRVRAGSLEPIQIHFRDYTKQDMLLIIAKDRPAGEENAAFFLAFASTVYDIFHQNCKDLNELRYLVAMIFPTYAQPVYDGLVQRHETYKLFRMTETHFARAADKLYLRDISSAEWAAARKNDQDVQEQDVAGHVELPYYSKFLLIASFLASYNPPRMDTRYFTRHGDQDDRRKRRKNAPISKAKVTRQQLLGPKVFPIERMLAIFYSIITDDVTFSQDIQSQVTSLITLRLLTRVSPADRLDDIRCRCNVSYEFIRKVAYSVRFEIDHYLFEFS